MRTMPRSCWLRIFWVIKIHKIQDSSGLQWEKIPPVHPRRSLSLWCLSRTFPTPRTFPTLGVPPGISPWPRPGWPKFLPQICPHLPNLLHTGMNEEVEFQRRERFRGVTLARTHQGTLWGGPGQDPWGPWCGRLMLEVLVTNSGKTQEEHLGNPFGCPFSLPVARWRWQGQLVEIWEGRAGDEAELGEVLESLCTQRSRRWDNKALETPEIAALIRNLPA